MAMSPRSGIDVAIAKGVVDGYSVFNYLQEFKGPGNRRYMAGSGMWRMGRFHGSRYALFFRTRGD